MGIYQEVGFIVTLDSIKVLLRKRRMLDEFLKHRQQWHEVLGHRIEGDMIAVLGRIHIYPSSVEIQFLRNVSSSESTGTLTQHSICEHCQQRFSLH
ncbi:MAG: hypothetical protein IKW46_01095 [Bacteroidaceae bacterium]|nr:hypothetical protein [Bacteroidaceae bacterium]